MGYAFDLNNNDMERNTLKADPTVSAQEGETLRQRIVSNTSRLWDCMHYILNKYFN